MATIKITDSTSVSATIAVADKSVIGRTSTSVLNFLRSDVITALDQTLDQVQIKSVALGFTYSPAFSFAGGSATFTAGGSLTGEVDLYKPGKGASSPLFPSDQFGADIEMGNNYYLALSLAVSAKATPEGYLGAFTLELAASAVATAKLYLPFGPDASGKYPTLKSALEQLLSAYQLPSQIGDFNAWPLGTVFTFDCQGALAFSGEIDLLAAVNPTASPGVSAKAGPISVSAGPSATIDGGFKLSGEYQARIWKHDAQTLQLGFYKKAATNFSVEFDASVGADATLGTWDIVANIYELLGDSGKLDPAWLKANVPASVADDVSTAYEAAVQKKLSIEIDAECDTSITDQAAFSWNFDMSAAAAEAQAAFLSAMRGELSPLLTAAALPAGVTKAGSVLDRIKESERSFVFNFLGLFDHVSVQDAVLDLNTKVSPDGQFILTDTAHLTRLSADATPFIQAAPLQKVIADDCTATVGYAAAFGNFLPQIKVDYNYYVFKAKAKPSDLALYLDSGSALLSKDISSAWSGIVQSSAGSQAAFFLAALTYDATAAASLFLQTDGTPRSVDDYQSCGRAALVLTPGLDLNPVFVQALGDDATWERLVDAGAANNVFDVLGVNPATPPQWAQVSFNWLVYLEFWASAMHSAGHALQAVSQYVKANPGLDPRNDQQFQNLRSTFASQLSSAIAKTPSMFGDDTGLFLMLESSKPASESVTVSYAGKSVTYP